MRRLLTITAGSAAALVAAGLAAAWVQLAALERADPFGRGTQVEQPSRIYARPLALHTGERLGSNALESHLVATRYRRVAGPHVATGEYARLGERDFRIGARAFHAPGSELPDGTISVRLTRDGRVASLRDARGRRVAELRLEPVVIDRLHEDDGRDRRLVSLDALPPHLVDAVLAIEDQRFYQHSGIDLRRIAGALWADLRAGRIVQGGSTLTQQLVKNLYLSRERSWLRKLEEAPLAVMLELRHGKREILEAYLNEVYLGQSGGLAIHGVGRAAEYWFGKPVESLSLSESALLAGMLRGPSLYSPRREPEQARARRDLVLARMRALGEIDEPTFEAARAEPLGVVAPRHLPRSARYFTDAIRAELLARYPKAELEQGGWSVYTSLDLRLQRIAEQAVRHGVEQLERATPDLRREDGPLQAALVALDPHSGDVLAMVGGRSYGRSQFNRAADARRQPGSVFKPVAALAALTPDEGQPPAYTLATLVDDAPLSVETPEGEWQPRDYDDTFRGPVTLREAVEQSLNVPMVRVGLSVGPPRVVQAARRLGIESPLHAVPSLVLGTSEVTLLEMTRAYGVLAAGGWRAAPRDVVAVLDAQGHPLERELPSGVQGVGPDEAYLLTSLLEGVVDHGTGAGLRARGFTGPVAGKTGTTDDYRDAWFIGYTPQLVVGVWVGFDDGRTLRHSGSSAALPIFADFLLAAVGPSGDGDFTVPPGIETVPVVAAAGHPAGLRCQGDPEVFLAGTAPREDCDPFRWFAEQLLRRRIGDWVGSDARGALPAVGAPRPSGWQGVRRMRLRLPSWLNPFRTRGER